MKEKVERYKRVFEEELQQLNEMSNISTKKTGLDYIVWILFKTGKEKHGPRIKIKIDHQFVPITISDTPELKSNIKIDAKKLNKIFKWILLNKDVLLDYWKGQGEVTIDEVLDNMKKVK